jgi:hypothetical protein
MVAAKPGIMKRQMDLLNERYDLSDRPARGVVMDRTKPVQEGVRVKLPAGVTWSQLDDMNPDVIRERGIFPKGFLPLPHANHPEGGMVFPKTEIDELNKQEQRDLTRFDLDFDIPDRFLAEFPAAMYLTTRPDLGDVSKGKLVTIENFNELFSGILNPKQLEGLRLLLTPFPQQQFNQTVDRRSDKPSRGVACLDLPYERRDQWRFSRGGRYQAAGVSSSHRDSCSTRREYSAAVRLAAGSEDGRGLHGVRAEGGLFRWRPGDRDEEGRQRSGARESGALHVGVPGDPGLSSRSEVDVGREVGPDEGDPGGAPRAGGLLWKRTLCGVPLGTLFHRQYDARPACGAVLHAAYGERHDDGARWGDQDVPAARHQRYALPTCTTAGH